MARGSKPGRMATTHLGAQTILDESPAQVYALDLDGRFLLANRALLRVLGVEARALLGKVREDVLPADIAEAHRADDLVVLASGTTREFEERSRQEDGEHVYWSIKFPIKNQEGDTIGLGAISTDITTQRRVEAERDRLMDLHVTMIQANEVMLRASNESDLFQNTCQVCTEAGSFDLAWIAIPKDGQVETVALAGPMKGYLEGLKVSLDPASPLGQGPTGLAFHEGKPVLCQDWSLDLRMAPWRERGARFGIRASGSFPIRTQAGVAALLTLYSRHAHFFNPDLAMLLENFTKDLAFALDKYREERQRREAEAALVEEKCRYEDLVQTQPAGIYRLRVRPVSSVTAKEWESVHLSHYQIDFVSDRFCEISGLQREAFQADPSSLLERIHQEDRDGFSEGNAEALTQKIPFRWEGRLAEDGGARWIRFESMPRSLPDGGTLWTGVLLDITEKKAAQDLVERQYAVLAGIMESAEGAIFSVDKAYCYTSFNQTHAVVMKALYGTDIALGTCILDHQAVPVDRDLAKANLDRALAGEAFTVEAMSGEESLSRCYFEVTHTPIRVRGGDVTGVAVFTRDISSRKQLEAQVLELNRDLERRVQQRTHELKAANEELEAFAYSVSHDLRAPLRTITGFTEALSRDADSTLSLAGLEYLKRINGGTLRMAQLIEDLLRLSRVGRDDYAAIPMDLGGLAEQVLEGLKASEPGRQVACQVQRPIRVMGDPRLLRLLLENLLGNAWKFTSHKTDACITIEAIPLGRTQVEVAIRDNGAGFPSSQAGKLFTPFYRLHKADEFPGTGIGLAIAKRIVSRHGGEIRADSELGRGAVIRFTLPMATGGLP